MIKLIASDMDGSLFNDKKEIPPEFFTLLPRLQERNITFIAASGRSYVTLRRNLSPASDQVDYICDNGAYVVEHGKVTHLELIDPHCLGELIRIVDALPDTRAVLCGTKSMYHHAYSDEFAQQINTYYLNHTILEDLTQVNDDIFKVAICDLKNPATGSYNYLNHLLGDRLSIQLSGPVWMDAMNKDVTKGTALAKIQQRLGITPEETMAFGDFNNDIEMLTRAHYSFVMENAAPDMFQYGNFIAKSNNEKGVIRAIEEYAL